MIDDLSVDEVQLEVSYQVDTDTEEDEYESQKPKRTKSQEWVNHVPKATRGEKRNQFNEEEIRKSPDSQGRSAEESNKQSFPWPELSPYFQLLKLECNKLEVLRTVSNKCRNRKFLYCQTTSKYNLERHLKYDPPMTIIYDTVRKKEPPPPASQYLSERELCMKYFDQWSEKDQVQFVESLLSRMCHYQQSQINSFLKPILKRDFISLLPKKGLDDIAENILSYLDAESLHQAKLVCREWRRIIAEGMLWKKFIERKVRTDPVWRRLGERRGWIQYLFKPKSGPHHLDHLSYRTLYLKILRDIENIEVNWRNGHFVLQRINCRSENSKGVYCLQYDDNKIVSGLRDNTIKIWDRNNLQCTKVLTGHTGSVLCLQYDDNMIVSGSSDSMVRVWDVHRGVMVNTLSHHREAVLHLRFANGMMVTCSKDKTIAVWDMISATEITFRHVLQGHRAAVNVVDFDDEYIVSASGDRSIKVWNTKTCEFVRTLTGHQRGIACLQYKDRLIVSGSSDNTIRLWDIEGACLRMLIGHEELVRCIRFDQKHIVSGAYDGKIKVWDLEAALDPRTPAERLCLQTLVQHTGRVFRLQFDEFQIVSSSHDDTILIWDFLNYNASTAEAANNTAPAESEEER